MGPIKISIIIPCYNQAQFLNETLQSVYNQTEHNWECLIIDDGSKDGTASLAKSWVLKDERFFYYYKENGGLSSARNFGLKKATGIYIQLLDADDLIEPHKFEKQLLDLKESDISVCDYVPFDHETGSFRPNRYLSPFLTEDNAKQEVISEWEYRKSIPCHSVLFRKEILDKHSIIFNENLPNHEDWVFWVQLIYFSDRIKNRKEKLAYYRIHNSSMSLDFVAMRQGFLKAACILQQFFKDQNNKELEILIKRKRKEIKTKGRTPWYIKIPKKVFAKLSRYKRNVRKN